MPEDNGRRVAKAVALLLVLGWLAISLSLTLEGIDAQRPPFFWAFTAVVFLIVGKLWDIEVQQYLGRR